MIMEAVVGRLKQLSRAGHVELFLPLTKLLFN